MLVHAKTVGPVPTPVGPGAQEAVPGVEVRAQAHLCGVPLEGLFSVYYCKEKHGGLRDLWRVLELGRADYHSGGVREGAGVFARFRSECGQEDVVGALHRLDGRGPKWACVVTVESAEGEGLCQHQSACTNSNCNYNCSW